MKNVLMASSAIVGAAVLVASPAAAQELKLSGFQQFFASGGGSDEGDTSDRSFSFSTNTEIHVNGSIMADNGITFGFRVEIEADSGTDNNVDENSIWASGGFGKLEFGDNDGAEDTFMVNGSNSGVDYGGVGNPTANFLSTAFAGAAPTSVDMSDSGDATKITYTTPNFNGFSAGLSYTPDVENQANGTGFQTNDSGGGLNSDGDEIERGLEDHIGIGLGYEGEFNGIGLELGVTGAFAQLEEVKPQGAFAAQNKDDFYAIGGGVAVSFSGFTIATGAFYQDSDDSASSAERWAWDAGVGYAAGPWSFSVNGIYSENEFTNDELLGGSANVGYNLAPGVGVFVTGYVGDEDLGSGGNNDIVALTSGLKVSF